MMKCLLESVIELEHLLTITSLSMLASFKEGQRTFVEEFLENFDKLSLTFLVVDYQH